MSPVQPEPSLSGFYKLSVAQRIERLQFAGWLTADDASSLIDGHFVLPVATANQMIENVVGVFGLPFAVVSNVRVNRRDFLVPMVVEEPSIVAAASAASRVACQNGGYQAEMDESLLIGQIELRGIKHVAQARTAIEKRTAEFLDFANSIHPNMVARGGGAKGLEIRRGVDPDDLIIHLLVDTCDAMGANLINTQCEALAPKLAEAAGAQIGLRILSNLADRSVVRARMQVSCDQLATSTQSGEAVRDAIIAANDLALADHYRAVTHNKGIMNGIDPVALATGNDWRAVEAAAHAYAARDGQYRALTSWSVSDEGGLSGVLTVPIKVGTVGGSLDANPGVELAYALLGTRDARELAMAMASVGLGQNFGAIRALATVGIQSGHMRLHARSVVQAASIPDHRKAAVTEALIESGDIKAWKAREIDLELESKASHSARRFVAAGKVILAGEHSVVYGGSALALPLADALSVQIVDDAIDGPMSVLMPASAQFEEIDPTSTTQLSGMVNAVLASLGVDGHGLRIEVKTRYAAGVGLGSSASFAVALARALAAHYQLESDMTAINAAAYAAESCAHGNASGLDNTLATYAEPLEFRRGTPPEIIPLVIAEPFQLLIMLSATTRPTTEMVAAVAALKRARPAEVDSLLAGIGDLCAAMKSALSSGDLAGMGSLMNLNHGYLNALGVSSPGLESLVDTARRHGALGAKLTGGGGGGAAIALVEPNVAKTLREVCDRRRIPNYLVEQAKTRND